MSPVTGNCSKILHIVQVRQMLQRWRKKSSSIALAPVDVPARHVVVHVGPSSRRFVVRAKYLNHPMFEQLLVEAEEEYGFCNHGPLTIPCDEALFQEILRVMSRSESTRKRCGIDVPIGESRPLLHDHPVC